jgi:hypothetical protein
MTQHGSARARLAALEKAKADREPTAVRFTMHPNPCPEAGPDGECPCRERAEAAGEPGEGIQ